MEKSVVGIVLAGGQSRRFGSPKAFAQNDGIPFYQYTIQSMKPFTESILIVSSSKLEKDFQIHDPTVQLITDNSEFEGLGPLAGIYSAMDKAIANWYLVAPIDVPFLEAWVFESLLHYTTRGTEVIVPIVNGRLQPLISIFNRSMKEKVKQQLKVQELSLKKLFDKCEPSYIEIDEERPFININHKEDFKRYIQNKGN